MIISGSHAVIQSLINEGVKVIFGYPGGQIVPIYDALFDYSHKIRHILVRHEQAAAHAAEGYARIKGVPGVCFATSGPGATNLTTGIADAMMDSIPLVCITGQVNATVVGTDAFQEVDIIGITTPITKWNYQVTQASEIPEIISKAFYIAGMGRPGPVLIDITRNAQIEKIDYTPVRCDKIESYQPNYFPNKKQIELAADIINQAKKPLLIVGHGVLISQAEKEVIKLMEKAEIPVVSTLLGLTAVPATHPLYFGMVGMHGHYAPNMLTNKADVILAVGMRFDDRVTGTLSTYARHAKIIHIDIDPAELNKNVKATIPIVADARYALQALIPLIEKKQPSEWLNKFKKHQDVEYNKLILDEIYPKRGKIHMGEVLHLLSEKTHDKTVLVTDVGQHQMMSARYFNHRVPRHFITSGGLGTMGFGLPAAIGAKIASVDKDTVLITGDGSIQMNIQEFTTLMQEKIPLKIIVLRNNFLGMVRQWQELFFQKRYSFVKLYNPDFVKVAKGFGLEAEKVTKREELKPAIHKLLISDKAYLLEVLVEDEQNVFPMVPAGASIEDVRLK